MDTRHDGNDWPRQWSLDDGPGPARPQSQGRADALVQGALAAHFQAAETPSCRIQAGAPARRRRPLWQVAAAVALAALGIAGASAAAMRFWGRASGPAGGQEPAPHTAPASARSAPVVEPPPPRPAPQAQDTHASAEPTPRGARPRRPARSHSARQAQDLLEQANAQRGERHYREAAATYTRAVAADPQGQAAYVARVASAALALEHLQQPALALSRYRAALRQKPHGVLAEEARFGVAEALRALGRPKDERQALRAFVKAHPHSGLRARAERRLATLETAVAD